MRSTPRSGARRRSRSAALIALLVIAVLPGCAQGRSTLEVAAGPANGGYLAFADRMQLRLDGVWDGAAGRYRSGQRETEAMLNGDMLLTHSVAALQGHSGPSRNDDRARRIARALVSAPTFVATLPDSFEDPQRHAPGFVDTMDAGERNQHLVIDSEIVDGLTYAWRARRELGLSRETAEEIADRIHRIARGRFYRWPTLRLNQINWYALLYAADATVTGDPRLLRTDLRKQLHRFFRRPRPSAAIAGNFGPGLHFHYLPERPRDHFMNMDSAEYANIVASFTRVYEQARRAGMRGLSVAEMRLAKQWLMRLLAGYWTHGGYLNWDTGFGFQRWHQAKKLGLSQQALIGIASSPSLAPDPRARGWAKWLLDRGLALYERTAERTGGIAPGLFFGVSAVPEGIGSTRLAAARIQSNAARAVAAGLERIPAEAPPALYSFDPDNGRLAVSTPTYNTSIVPVNRHAFPYGGIELARLFDGAQEPAAGIGGRPPASFGLLVSDIAGRHVLATQLAKRPGGTPLRLTRAPAGVGASPAATPPRAYAGTFGELRATGTVAAAGLTARTSHRFTPSFVETRWSVTRRTGEARETADVLFPSWGRRSAQIWAVGHDGRRTRVGPRPVGGGGVKYLYVRSARSGYVVVPAPGAGFTVQTIRPAPQDSDPNPGPTLIVRLADRRRFRHVAFAARLAPAHTADEAARVAARLRGAA
jgi:hypothetical protein